MEEVKILNDSTKKKSRAIHCLVPLKTDKPILCKSVTRDPLYRLLFQETQPLTTIVDRYYLGIYALDRQRVELILTTIGPVIVSLPHIIWRIIFDLQPEIVINPNKFKKKSVGKKTDDGMYEDNEMTNPYYKNNNDFYEDMNEWKKYHTRSRILTNRSN